MKMINNFVLLLFSYLICSGFGLYALEYDHSYTPECLANPLKPQYAGGIVVNPELDDDLNGWSTFGSANIEKRVSRNGNKFIVALHRKGDDASFSQKFNMDKEKLYTFSAWLQVSDGPADIAAMFKTASGYKHAGSVIAQAGCWSMLKGGLVVNTLGPAELYFESKNSSAEIWADSISLQPFTQEEWKSHQDINVEKFRKGKVRFQAVDNQGNPLANATISITQKNGGFPFGTAITNYILSNKGYQNWFLSRFKYTVFENEMKWVSTEPSQGRENYAVPDAMLRLVRSRGIAVRGHNVIWDDPKFQPGWVYNLNPGQLAAAAQRRINSIVRRYAGQVISWDVVNENLHNSFYESRLGADASARFYKQANSVDRSATPFLNEYNTLEEKRDGAVTPAKYLQKIRQLRSQGYNGPLGIGLQGHFGVPDLAYMRSAIDILSSARLPMWISELDVKSNPNQAQFLEQVIREAHSHPSIGGIVMWAAWRPFGCYAMCLTDNNFRNLPTGNVVDKILKEWGLHASVATTDSNGYFEANLFHGDYVAEFNHPSAANSTIVKSFQVVPEDDLHEIVQVKVSA